MSLHHHHGHVHGFGQDKRRPGETKTLIVIALTAVMMVVEVYTGIIFGSMALLADGMHMASHAVALSITAFAYWYARKHAHDHRFSFGTGKVNALGGYTGAILLALFALMMAVESIERLINPTHIAFNSAIAVAVIGLLVNGASVFILGDNHSHGHGHDHGHDHHGHHHHHHDHNLRSAYLHVMADALTSLTAIGGLLTAKYFGWIWMDPVMGLVGSALVARWSIGLLKQTSGLLLDHQADDEMLEEIRSAVQADGQAEVEDLHVWNIGPGIYSVILAINTVGERTPQEFRDKFDAERFPHITVELHRKTT
jgi:cation diffusion facilitator family transporter